MCYKGDTNNTKSSEILELNFQALKGSKGGNYFKITPGLLYSTLVDSQLPEKDRKKELWLPPIIIIDVPVHYEIKSKYGKKSQFKRWRRFCKHPAILHFTETGARKRGIELIRNYYMYHLIGEVLFMSGDSIKGTGSSSHVTVNVKQYNGDRWYHVDDAECYHLVIYINIYIVNM